MNRNTRYKTVISKKLAQHTVDMNSKYAITTSVSIQQER